MFKTKYRIIEELGKFYLESRCLGWWKPCRFNPFDSLEAAKEQIKLEISPPNIIYET